MMHKHRAIRMDRNSSHAVAFKECRERTANARTAGFSQAVLAGTRKSTPRLPVCGGSKDKLPTKRCRLQLLHSDLLQWGLQSMAGESSGSRLFFAAASTAIFNPSSKVICTVLIAYNRRSLLEAPTQAARVVHQCGPNPTGVHRSLNLLIYFDNTL